MGFLDSANATLRNGMELELAAGTGHYRSRLFLLPSKGLVRFVVDEPIPLKWGMRFLLIRHGGSEIICGGQVVWTGETSRDVRRVLSEVFGRGALPNVDRETLGFLVNGYAPKKKTGRFDESIQQVSIGPWVYVSERLKIWEKTILDALRKSDGLDVARLGSVAHIKPEPLHQICQSLAKKSLLIEKNGLYFAGTGGPEGNLSPFGRKLLSDLRDASIRGLEPARIKIAGAQKELRNLARMGLAVSFEGALFYSMETYQRVVHQITDGLKAGSTFTIAYAKDKTSLSRKYIIPLLNRMETDGVVRREGDVRVVTNKTPTEVK